MSNKIIIKNGSGAPGTILETAELGYDKTGKRLYSGNGASADPTCINPLGARIDESRFDCFIGINADAFNSIPANAYATFKRAEVAVNNALTNLYLQILNKSSLPSVANSITLLSSEGYILKDANGIYLTAKEGI